MGNPPAEEVEGLLRSSLSSGLERLRLDHVDLFLVHNMLLPDADADRYPGTPRPLPAASSPLTPPSLSATPASGWSTRDRGHHRGGRAVGRRREARYGLPEGCGDALTDPDDLANILPLARAFVAVARQFDRAADAFSNGGGVPYAAYGEELVEAQAGINRPIYRHLLAEWLTAVPDVHARLQADPPARVADVACGGAWSSVALARAYPRISVDGFDSDEASAELARHNVEEAGLGDRLRVEAFDGRRIGDGPGYDLVTIFEAVHDMARPVEVLRRVRELTADGGTVIVMDENVGDSFETPGPIDAFMYAASFLLCLPAALAEGMPSARAP